MAMLTEAAGQVSDRLIMRYWKPVHVYICWVGHASEAADLAQDFFVHCLCRELFGRADRARERFRRFLLTCLNHFLADARRARQRHGPPQVFCSIQQLVGD